MKHRMRKKKGATHDSPIKCGKCEGTGCLGAVNEMKSDCKNCDGKGWFGINPVLPINLPIGERRIPYYQVRYASGNVIINQLDGLSVDQLDRIAVCLELSLEELFEKESSVTDDTLVAV